MFGEKGRQANRKKVAQTVIDYAAVSRGLPHVNEMSQEDLARSVRAVEPSKLGEAGLDFVVVATEMKALKDHEALKERVLRGYLPTERTWDLTKAPGDTAEEREFNIARMESALAAGRALQSGSRRDLRRLNQALERGRKAEKAFLPIRVNQATRRTL